MDAYVYNAALICEDCALHHIARCKNGGQPDTGDSDDYPQGPYADGGGETDGPQHCHDCYVFLENPLTAEGVRYVEEVVARSQATNPVAREWSLFYDLGWIKDALQ